MNGISVWPVEVGVENQTRLRGVSTPLDAIPLLGAVARWVAKSQSEQSRSAAAEEVKQKIADKARERVDAEARKRLTEFVARMNQRVFDPLNALVVGSADDCRRDDREAVYDAAAAGGRRPVGQPHAAPPGARRQPGERADPRIGAQQRHSAAATQRPHVHAARAVEARRRPAEPPGALGNQPRTCRREDHLRREGSR